MNISGRLKQADELIDFAIEARRKNIDVSIENMKFFETLLIPNASRTEIERVYSADRYIKGVNSLIDTDHEIIQESIKLVDFLETNPQYQEVFKESIDITIRNLIGVIKTKIYYLKMKN